MQKLILFVFLSTLLLGLSHGFRWGFAEEDQIMPKQVRNGRNVEMEATNEGPGEEASDQPAMRPRREVNEDGSSSSDNATTGEATTMEKTTEETTTEEPTTTAAEETTTEEPTTTTAEETTTEEPTTTTAEETTTEEPTTTAAEETTTEKTINASIITTPYVPTTKIIILPGRKWILHENETITDGDGNVIKFNTVEECTEYINTDMWLNGSSDKNPEECADELSNMQQSYGKWWALGLAFIISTCVSCCCCCFCIALDCYLQYTDNHIRLFSR